MRNDELPTVYVKWAYTDELGNISTTDSKWFMTQGEADAWIQSKKKKNGSYFQVIKCLAHADYSSYVRMNQLTAELESLRRQF